MDGVLTLHVAAAAITGIVLGGMIFFAFVFAPLVFRKLAADVAAAFIAEAFALYYRTMAIAAILAALAIWYRADALVMGLVAIGFIFAYLVLMPRIAATRAARERGDEDAGRRFRRLHALSMILNLAQMIAVAVVFLRLIR